LVDFEDEKLFAYLIQFKMDFIGSVSSPSRYINNEVNAVKKRYLQSNSIKVALCFPDVYEVAMSHLGLRILYGIINSLPYASAERVFSPWIDLEDRLRKDNIPLLSLETKTPLKEFDIVGFSLQYELSYTTVLNMLDLGKMPLRSEERLKRQDFFPIVIAGGPCTVNPYPMSPFIDTFLIGDGEDAIVELIDRVRCWKISGDGKKMTILREIAKIDGFYVPLIHGKDEVIKRRYVKDLNHAYYPTSPVVPYKSIVHDRINIEVSRGCIAGCRFCQAGMIYRPLRERSPERVLHIASESLKNTGYDELSFTSLSAGDYSHLLYVMKECNRRFGDSKISLSLPSLRVNSVNQEILKEIRSVRKTGFTIAPEAATERLRIVINKDFNEADYERALNVLFSEGWHNLKLYFMIGLPTETDEDVEAIKAMAMKALSISKRYTGRFVNVSITISPFVPKPHTPFQWIGQISLEEIKRKQNYLKEILSKKKFKYKGHNEYMSFLEAIFSRGDEKLSDLIEEAWRQGCKLDGWSENFDFNKWLKAMEISGIDGFHYAQRSFSKEDRLPWDNINIGIRKEFLLKELDNAFSGRMTADCRKVCSGCGLKCAKKDEDEKIRNEVLVYSSSKGYKKSDKKIKVRVQFSKSSILRYLSHLEIATTIIRGLRRAEVPFDFSKGFHPSPMVSFGPPLSVGIAGLKEYFDMDVFVPFDLKFYLNKLNETMPEGIIIKKMAEIPFDTPSLNSFIKRYEYTVKARNGIEIQQNIRNSPLLIKRDDSFIDIFGFIESIEVINRSEVRLLLLDRENLKVRIKEIIELLFETNIDDLDITRVSLYGQINNEWVEPL
jgi:radical SAM family uncharacterized protein/radical SAM-linked protein